MMSDTVLFSIRRNGNFLDIEIHTFNAHVEMGLFDEVECESLRDSLLDAVYELNGFIGDSLDSSD